MNDRFYVFRWLEVIAMLAALVASSMLLVSHIFQSPGFCGPSGGCHDVAQSAYSHIGPVPLAVIGPPALLIALIASIWGNSLVRRLLPILGALFFVSGVALMVIQFAVIHAICPYCMVVDSGSILFGLATIANVFNRALRDHVAWFFPIPLSIISTLCIVVPLVIGARLPRHQGPSITADFEPIPDSCGPCKPKVLREFIDLQCPYCRHTYITLRSILAAHPEIAIERHYIPLAMHPHAMTSSIAAMCARAQGAEDKFIDALLTYDEPDADACEKSAKSIGLDWVKFTSCLKDQRVKQKIVDETTSMMQSCQIRGLPTLDYDGHRLAMALQDSDDAMEFLGIR
jgi:uncharacterized membrane protein